MQGLTLLLTHTGSVEGSILINDIRDGQERETLHRKEGSNYIPYNETVEYIYSGLVAISFESGAIRRFITSGHLTATFSWGETLQASLPASPTSVITTVTDADSPFTLTEDMDVILVDTTGGAVELLLYAPSEDNAKKRILIKDVVGNAGTNSITITPDGVNTIENGNSLELSTDNDCAVLLSDGDSNHIIVSI